LIARLIGLYRAAGRRVGVIAVDPTSPLTGGAILGDRIRLMDYHGDPDVFIRSMANRGHAGGLAGTTSSVADVLDAAGFDPILIETLGVGQDEVEIARLAHTVTVLQVPGLGDTVQTLKAGLLEIADVLVVNKADLPSAERLVRDLSTMLTLGERGDQASWSPPVLRTSATTGEGVDRLVAVLEEHRTYLQASGELVHRERELAAAEISRLLRQALLARLTDADQESGLSLLVDQVVERSLSPADVVSLLLAEVAG
jgi:LAO/AO transport system kinase